MTHTRSDPMAQLKSSLCNSGKLTSSMRSQASTASMPRLISRRTSSRRKNLKLFRRKVRLSLLTRKQLSSSSLKGISLENLPNKLASLEIPNRCSFHLLQGPLELTSDKQIDQGQRRHFQPSPPLSNKVC